MKSKSNTAAPRLRATPAVRRAEVFDASLADESADMACLDRLAADAERSAHDVDDGMNATEASEERHAAAEARAMR